MNSEKFTWPFLYKGLWREEERYGDITGIGAGDCLAAVPRKCFTRKSSGVEEVTGIHCSKEVFADCK